MSSISKKLDNAYKASNGFIVHYDPQVQMVPNAKTGLPTKTPVKGPSPGLNKAGKFLPRPTFPTNYRVEIAPQGGEARADGGAVNHGQQKIHPDYAAQQFHNFHMFNGPEFPPLAKGERPEQYFYCGPVEGDRQLGTPALSRAMGGLIGKADGGRIDEEAPMPAPVTSGPKTVFAYGGKQYEFAVTPPDKQITSKDLAAQTTDALQQHLALPARQQVANSKAAANKLAPYVGRDKKGAVKPFLTMNAKLEKASAGYEAGPRYDAQAPLELEGGVGVETIGMPLSPSYEHNKFKVCPNSAVCKDECLGVTSGNYAQADWWPRQNSKNRTQAFMSEPGALAVQLHNEIQNAKSAAAMRGNRLAVRLNVLSDIDPRVHETLIKANPDVDFYDYTKMNYDPIAPNHHYTYSSTGLSQPSGVNGLTDGVENKHQNWKQMRNRLDTGSNVAMVFSHKEHLPREVYDRETDKTYRVVDGTTHDYRPLDKQAEGSNGVIIGLQNLNKTGKSGFKIAGA
jgi:hypothetical protein